VPHHLMISSERGVALKSQDCWTIPLTNQEHMELHQRGSKCHKEWFAERGLSDPEELAMALWQCSGDEEQMQLIVELRRP